MILRLEPSDNLELPSAILQLIYLIPVFAIELPVYCNEINKELLQYDYIPCWHFSTLKLASCSNLAMTDSMSSPT